MAIDQDTIDHYDPIISALKARLEVLEGTPSHSDEPPSEYVMRWADGKEAIYDLRVTS